MNYLTTHFRETNTGGINYTARLLDEDYLELYAPIWAKGWGYNYPLDDDLLEEQFIDEFTSPHSTIFILVQDDKHSGKKVIGDMSISSRGEVAYNLEDEAQGQLLMPILWMSVTRFAKAQGLTELSIDVARDNIPSRKTALRWGFRRDPINSRNHKDDLTYCLDLNNPLTNHRTFFEYAPRKPEQPQEP